MKRHIVSPRLPSLPTITQNSSAFFVLSDACDNSNDATTPLPFTPFLGGLIDKMTRGGRWKEIQIFLYSSGPVTDQDM